MNTVNEILVDNFAAMMSFEVEEGRGFTMWPKVLEAWPCNGKAEHFPEALAALNQAIIDLKLPSDIIKVCRRREALMRKENRWEKTRDAIMGYWYRHCKH